MKPALIPIAVILLTSGAGPAATQTPAPPPPTTAAVEVTECAQAQMVVDRLLDAADARIETSRQTNTPADLRAAVDRLQQTLRDVRAQLAPCANLQPSDLHGPHVIPKPLMSPSAAPTAPAGAPARPAAPADPHAGHVMTPAATPAAKPVAKPAPTVAKPAPAAKPRATDPHADHTAPAPATPAPPSPTSPAQAVDPVCGLKVDPATAPKTSYQGRTYYFCSEQHQQLFQKNAAKYLPRGQS